MPRRLQQRGFTLIELVVVMAIVALLVSIAAPRYFRSVERARENVLRQNLSLMRDAIDKFNSDNGRYPETIADLATKRYIRKVPDDPLTGSDGTWVIVQPPESSGLSGVYDIKSGAEGTALDGSQYSSW
ncbi:MAG: prepilin-type N-terminal cleavage/methylation protein [Betaproteobacteria bacterium]|nr:prepilin-type N-terminal cleavage/methylation protein [Betaproteobacteria bacterium]